MVGVPLITPVGDSTMPGGRDPESSDHVKVPLPPEAVSVCGIRRADPAIRQCDGSEEFRAAADSYRTLIKMQPNGAGELLNDARRRLR